MAVHKLGNTDQITLLVQDGEYFRTIPFDYHDGLRYPHLECIAGTTDWLKGIYGVEDKPVKGNWLAKSVNVR